MHRLKVDYSKQFTGIEQRPDSYRVLADRYEWAKRDVDQDIEGHRYDECNTLLDGVLRQVRGKVIVECGCGLGRNLHRFARDNTCVGIDFSTTCLKKITAFASGVIPVNADIRSLPLQDGSVDYVIFCNVLFIYEDTRQIVHMLSEARRVLKTGGQVIMINDYCSIGVLLAPWLRLPPVNLRKREGGGREEFLLYYFTDRDSQAFLQQAGLQMVGIRHCNFHMGVYHLTYLSPVFGLLLRHHRRHRLVRRMDHWERVRSGLGINDAYPLNRPGRFLALFSRRFFPSLAALSVCCLAEK